MPAVPHIRHWFHDITLEHCYVLLARLGDTFDLMENSSGNFREVIDLIDAKEMQEHFQAYFDPGSFSRLFNSDLGKGVLVGSFAQQLMERADLEQAELDASLEKP